MGTKLGVERKLVGVSEAAQMLGLSVWTLRSWCYRGQCASNKLGMRLMVPQAEVDRIIAETARPRLRTRQHRTASVEEAVVD